MYETDHTLWQEELFFKNKIYREYQQPECYDVIHAQCLILKDQDGKDRKYYQRDHLLYYLELKEAERATVAVESYSIGGDLKGIFKKCNAPADQDDAHQPKATEAFHILKLQMAVPCHSHKGIGYNEQDDRDDSFLHAILFKWINKDPTLSRWGGVSDGP
jgi:hypothetical protein